MVLKAKVLHMCGFVVDVYAKDKLFFFWQSQAPEGVGWLRHGLMHADVVASVSVLAGACGKSIVGVASKLDQLGAQGSI